MLLTKNAYGMNHYTRQQYLDIIKAKAMLIHVSTESYWPLIQKKTFLNNLVLFNPQEVMNYGRSPRGRRSCGSSTTDGSTTAENVLLLTRKDLISGANEIEAWHLHFIS